MTIEEMNTKRKELGLTYRYIADHAGMPISTVQKILGGLTQAPRKDSLQKIQRVLAIEAGDMPDTESPVVSLSKSASEAGSASYLNARKSERLLTVAEQALAYGSKPIVKKQGEYTVEDYYAIPDEYRSELIDGVLYDMTAPVPAHQIIAGDIYAQLLQFRNKKKGPCLPMISPVDVQLDCDNKTMLQPDVLIVCDRSKIIKRCVYGAPDFIVEVLSPSTRKKDMSIKMEKYFSAGVREYWLVDPGKRRVIAYDIEHLDLPCIYGFRDLIPVKVWGGECTITLADTDELLDELYGKGEIE